MLRRIYTSSYVGLKVCIVRTMLSTLYITFTGCSGSNSSVFYIKGNTCGLKVHPSKFACAGVKGRCFCAEISVTCSNVKL